MSISLENNTVYPGSEVAIKIALTNTSEKEIHIFRAKYALTPYRFSVVDQEGKPARLTPLGQAVVEGKAGFTNEKGETRILIGGGLSRPVAPGKTLDDLFFVSGYVDLSQPGRYTMRLTRPDPYTNLVVESNPVTLTVAKRE